MSDSGARRRPPKPITEASLREAALRYLERQGTSRAHLRRVLSRRLDRAYAEHGGDRAEQARWVEALLDELERVGYLDDLRYAEGRARSLARAGRGTRVIRARLRQKEVAPERIEDALARVAQDLTVDLAETPGDLDLVAACHFARRRRLGPYRREGAAGPLDPALRQRELAKFARSGFSYEVASRIVDAATIEDISEMLSVFHF